MLHNKKGLEVPGCQRASVLLDLKLLLALWKRVMACPPGFRVNVLLERWKLEL